MSEEDKLIEKYKKDRESIDILQCRFLIDYYQDLYQKEKEKNKILEELLQGRLFELYNYYKNLAGSYQANSISKDKIKAKIKELEEKSDYWNCDEIQVLTELLEEN